MFSSDVKIRLCFAVTGKRSCAQLHPSYSTYFIYLLAGLKCSLFQRNWICYLILCRQ